MTAPFPIIRGSPRVTRHSKGRAFTLLELLGVTALMALAVGLVTLKLDSLTAAGKVRSVASQIGSYVRLAQADARTSGTSSIIEMDSAKGWARLRRATSLPQTRKQEFKLSSQVDLTHVWFDSDRRGRDDGPLVLRIDGHGRYRCCVLLFESQGSYAVCVLPCLQPPRVYPVAHKPRAVTYDELLAELAHETR